MIAASASRASHLDANGSWLVELEGEHDIATIPLLQQQTRDVWPRCTLAVIDLSAATFIDCSVVAWLLRSRDALDDNTSVVRRLRVAEGRSAPAVQRVFDVLRLREEFDCYATRAGALDDRRGHRLANATSAERGDLRAVDVNAASATRALRHAAGAAPPP